MIFFNVPEAREQLMEKGLVYTLRSSSRAVGKTIAVTGSYSKYDTLCLVQVKRVTAIRHPDDLHPYLNNSGFGDVDTWLSKATTSARTLYKVEKLEQGEEKEQG